MLPYNFPNQFFFDEENEELLSSLKEIIPGAIYHFKKLNNVNTFSTAKDFKKVSYDEAITAINEVTSPELLHEVIKIEKRKKVLLAISENIFLAYEDAETLAKYAFKEYSTEMLSNLFAKQSRTNIFKLYETFKNEPKLLTIGVEPLAALGTPKSFNLAKEINASREFNQHAQLFSAACFKGSRVSTKALLDFYVQENISKPRSYKPPKYSLDNAIKELARRVYKNGHESIVQFLTHNSFATLREILYLVNNDVNSLYTVQKVYSLISSENAKNNFITCLLETKYEFTLEDVILMKDNFHVALESYGVKITREAAEFILSENNIEHFLKDLKSNGNAFNSLYYLLDYPQRVVAIENYTNLSNNRWSPLRGEISALYEHGLSAKKAVTYAVKLSDFTCNDQKRLIPECLENDVNLPLWLMRHLNSKQVDVYLEKLKTNNPYFANSIHNKNHLKELLVSNISLSKKQRTYLASLLPLRDFQEYFNSSALNTKYYSYNENIDFDALVESSKGQEYKKWASEVFVKNSYLGPLQEAFASSVLMHVSLNWKYAHSSLTTEAYKAFKARHGINPELWEIFLTMFPDWEGTFESLLEVTENI